ncbi:MAG: FkbM family methyltransferase [Gloeomargaritaceae cyanobacterium C42_A2020_066]|nr:FkbM family methyltransferase [Gloeomargaritaceae cyanobacterium C42_A2020_066]
MPQAAFLPYLKQMGYLDGITMTICFVGSRKLSEQDDLGKSNWSYFVPNLKVYGFDADADACEEANMLAQSFPWQEEHFPLALSAEVGEKTLYVTKAPMCSSLYPPNEHFARRLKDLNSGVELWSLMGLDFTLQVETTTLDTFAQENNLGEIDFIKTDVQGADLDVLKGAARLLDAATLGVVAEVCYQPLYLGQPLFSDVDSYMRTIGFSLFTFGVATRGRGCSPLAPAKGLQQFLWGDALYLRDPLQPDYDPRFLSPEKLLKLACIAEVHGACDFCAELLEHLTLLHGENPRWNMTPAIREALCQFPKLAQDLDNLPIMQRLNSSEPSSPRFKA